MKVLNELVKFSGQRNGCKCNGFQWAKVEKFLLGLRRDDYFIWQLVGKCTCLCGVPPPMALQSHPSSVGGRYSIGETRERAGPSLRAKAVPMPGRQKSYGRVHCQMRLIGTAIGPKCAIETDADSCNYQAGLQKKLENKALKL